MITRARDDMRNSAMGIGRRTPTSDRVESVNRDPDEIEKEGLDRSGARSRLARIGAAAGLFAVLAVLGSAAALAWRAHMDLPLIAEAQRQETRDLQAAIQRLELTQQQMAQNVGVLQQTVGAWQQNLAALQAVQQKNEQSRLLDVQRFSEQLASFQAEVAVAKSAAKKQSQKRNSTAGTAPKSQASNVPSSKLSAEVQN